MQIEDQFRASGFGQFLVSLDSWIGCVDDYSQPAGDGAGGGDHPFNYRNTFNFKPCLVQLHSRTSTSGLNERVDGEIFDCGLLVGIQECLSFLRLRIMSPNYGMYFISGRFSKSAIRLCANWPQSATAYAIFPGEVALSAIGDFQIKEVANHEKNGDADFPDYFGG